MLRAKPVISYCLFWSKFMKCGSNLFSVSTHDLKVYFHPKAKLRVVLGMSLTESCFLVEEYTFFNTHSIFPAFYQQGFSSLSQATVFPILPLQVWLLFSALSLAVPISKQSLSVEKYFAQCSASEQHGYVAWTFGRNCYSAFLTPEGNVYAKWYAGKHSTKQYVLAIQHDILHGPAFRTAPVPRSHKSILRGTGVGWSTVEP